MMKGKLIFCLAGGILALLLLDGIGHLLGWSHSELFIGEQLVYGFVIILGGAAIAWLLRFLIRRQAGYYDDLRDRPPLIEARRSDWEHGDDA